MTVGELLTKIDDLKLLGKITDDSDILTYSEWSCEEFEMTNVNKVSVAPDGSARLYIA